jgi:hypothetical protein
MRKIVTAFVAALALGVAAVGTSSTADAWWGPRWGWGPGPFVAGAIVGGAVAGAVAAPYYYRPYGPYYPYYGPGCRRVWNGYNWVRACY